MQIDILDFVQCAEKLETMLANRKRYRGYQQVIFHQPHSTNGLSARIAKK
jgi:hypothetical protein